jgi:hypothetical protein
MKKLTKEELGQLKAKPHGRANYLRGVLMNMAVGEIVLIEPKDWTQVHRKPGTYCLQLGRKTGMGWKCMTVIDGSGWVVERIK